MNSPRTTIAIVGGAGTVGSALAFSLLSTLDEIRVVLIDRDAAAARVHEIDLAHLTALGRGEVEVADIDSLASADVVVVAASVRFEPSQTREEMASRNAELLSGLVGPLRSVRADALVIVATNPVDAVITTLVRLGILTAGQVLGFSLNDSIRYRAALARALDVDVREVAAWNLGQHGGVQVPVHSAVTVNGTNISVPAGLRAEIEEELASWFRHWQELRPGRSTGWASAAGITTMVRAWLDQSGAPLPCARYLTGEYGIHDVAVAVPVALVGDRPRVEAIELAEEEQAGLRRAAAAVAGTAEVLHLALLARGAGPDTDERRASS